MFSAFAGLTGVLTNMFIVFLLASLLFFFGSVFTFVTVVRCAGEMGFNVFLAAFSLASMLVSLGFIFFAYRAAGVPFPFF